MPGRIKCGATEFFLETLLGETGEIDFEYDLAGVIERALEHRFERISLFRQDVNGSEQVNAVVISLHFPKCSLRFANLAGRRAGLPQEKQAE